MKKFHSRLLMALAITIAITLCGCSDPGMGEEEATGHVAIVAANTANANTVIVGVIQLCKGQRATVKVDCAARTDGEVTATGVVAESLAVDASTAPAVHNIKGRALGNSEVTRLTKFFIAIQINAGCLRRISCTNSPLTTGACTCQIFIEVIMTGTDLGVALFCK